MGCTVLDGLPAADLLSAFQQHSEGIPLVIFDLLNLIVNPTFYRRSGAHIGVRCRCPKEGWEMAVARIRGESASTAKLHPTVHHHERERESGTGLTLSGWGQAMIEGTTVRGEG
jgi:hypothetical protein